MQKTTRDVGIDYECRVQQFFDENEMSIFETPESHDYGCDLVLYYAGHIIAIQCKYRSSSVGVDAVQQITAAMPMYNADIGMVITNAYFTRPAIKLADANKIILIDGNEFAKNFENIYGDLSFLDMKIAEVSDLTESNEDSNANITKTPGGILAQIADIFRHSHVSVSGRDWDA